MSAGAIAHVEIEARRRGGGDARDVDRARLAPDDRREVDQPGPAAERPQTERHAGGRHVGAAQVEEIRIDAGLIELGVELERAIDVAERAERQLVQAERPHDVRLAPGARQLRAFRLEQRREPLHAVQVDHGDLGAHQPVEQEVALQRRPPLAVQQDQRHLEAELAAPRR